MEKKGKKSKQLIKKSQFIPFSKIGKKNIKKRLYN